jgi:peptidoglycan/LPS O-acetylase OafA/YrhL
MMVERERSDRYGFRGDIDGLRCLAVVSVILFHYDFNFLPGGYAGVDVFFVISGYLIVGHINADLEAGRFTFAEFYERRIRRLFPAFWVVASVCCIVAWFLFLPDEAWRFGRSLIATALYVSNMVFWKEEDYFNRVSELKPLAHTWSLGVEEQFYVVIPVIVVLFHKFWRSRLLTAMFCLSILSFLLSEALLASDASAAFYLLPARMWELLTGACLALAWQRLAAWRIWHDFVGVAGLACIIASFLLLNKTSPFPGASAALPCFGAAMVILSGERNSSMTARFLSFAPFGWIGRISYSLYLWHWPVLVFAQYWLLEPLGAWRSLAAICVTVAFAALSQRFIEQPFRNRRVLRRDQLFALAAVSSIFLITLGAGFWATQGAPWRFPALANVASVATESQDPREGVCILRPEQDAGAWSPSLCKLTDGEGGGSPVLLWGDSHAFHLRHGILAESANIGRPIYVFTSSACPPIIGVEVAGRPKCKSNNDFALQFIRRAKVKSVILAANWNYAAVSNKIELRELRNTLRELESLDVDVTVIGQLPIYDLQNPQYLFLRLKSANYPEQNYAVPSRSVEKTNITLKSVADPHFFDVFSFFCVAGRCDIVRDSKLMVVDSSHLSPSGSALVVKELIRRGILQ